MCYSLFHENGSFIVHSFNSYYLSIPEYTCSWGNRFQETHGIKLINFLLVVEIWKVVELNQLTFWAYNPPAKNKSHFYCYILRNMSFVLILHGFDELLCAGLNLAKIRLAKTWPSSTPRHFAIDYLVTSGRQKETLM